MHEQMYAKCKKQSHPQKIMPGKNCIDRYATDNNKFLGNRYCKTGRSFPDECVDPRNALVLAEAYVRAKVPCELHLYPDGQHGIGLGDPEKYPRSSRWTYEAAAWVRGLCTGGGRE